MKFLTRDLYEKVSKSELLNEDLSQENDNIREARKYEEEWNKQYCLYLKEFEKISERFPKAFLKEYNKDLMHDSIIQDIQIERKALRKHYRYDMTIKLLDYYKEALNHVITFLDISCLKTNLLLCNEGDSYWLYNEFLAVNSDRLSFEVAILDNSTLYCEFSKLRYKKVRLNV